MRDRGDSSLTPVSQHEDILTGIAAGGYAVEVEDFDFAYALYSGATRVAAFREGRIGYRMWATRTGRLSPSVEDRYDHDVDDGLASQAYNTSTLGPRLPPAGDVLFVRTTRGH